MEVVHFPELNNSGEKSAGEKPEKPAVPIATNASAIRSDIQFMRALSVIFIVCFHLDFALFKGGFMGVDIFFVISGYLVVGPILLKQADFSLLPFLGQRIKRLFLPSHLCLFLIIFVLSKLSANHNFGPSQAEDIFAASLLYVNEQFYTQQTAYFARNVLTKSLVLHYWSLCLEWQLYILFPLVFLVLVRFFTFAERYAAGAVVSTLRRFLYFFVLGTSFVYCFAFANDSERFFTLFPRVWQFLCGGLCCVIVKNFPKFIEESKVLGLFYKIRPLLFLLLTVCAMTFSSKRHPSLEIVVPVVITMILLLINKPLDFYPMTLIGDWSYSIYLYHWPTIIVVRQLLVNSQTFGPVSQVIIILIVTFVLATSSYYMIEMNQRNIQISPQFWILAFLFTALFLGMLSPLSGLASLQTQSSNPSGYVLQPPAVMKKIVYKSDGSIDQSVLFSDWLPNPKIPLTQQVQQFSRRHVEAKEWPWYKVWGGKFEGQYDWPEAAARSGYQMLFFKELRTLDRCVNVYGDSHIMSWIPMIEEIAAAINASMIFSVQSQAIPPKLTTNRIPLVDGFPPRIKECKLLLTFYTQHNSYIIKQHQYTAVSNDTKTVVDFWSARGDLIVIEDTPPGPEYQCVEQWVGQISHRLSRPNVTLEAGDEKLSIPACQLPQDNVRHYFDQMFHSKLNEPHPELKENVHYVNFNEFICPPNQTLCLPNIGMQPIYRDTHHLAMEFARGMLPVMVKKLSDIPHIYEKYIKGSSLDQGTRRRAN